jgi:four helix bundle protein
LHGKKRRPWHWTFIDVHGDFQRTNFTDSLLRCGERQFQYPINIAEGRGRHLKKEFVQFLYHARGSLLELENQVEIACELGYLDDAAFALLIHKTEELGRILNGLVNRFQLQTQQSL